MTWLDHLVCALVDQAAIQSVPVEYTPHIDAIIAWLRSCGVTVHEHAHDLPDEVSGLYRSETREIFLNEPSAPAALRTIAHEAGHWLGYLIDEKPHSYQRERQAFVYGWHVLRWFDAPVTRAEWIRSHRGARDRVAGPTEHLYRGDAIQSVQAEGSGPVQIDDSVRDVCDRGALETIAAYHRLGEHTHGSWSDQILSSLSLIHWRFG